MCDYDGRNVHKVRAVAPGKGGPEGGRGRLGRVLVREVAAVEPRLDLGDPGAEEEDDDAMGAVDVVAVEGDEFGDDRLATSIAAAEAGIDTLVARLQTQAVIGRTS